MEWLPRNPNLTKYSQNLRKRPTDAERKLWSNLRLKQLYSYQFYRQRVMAFALLTQTRLAIIAILKEEK